MFPPHCTNQLPCRHYQAKHNATEMCWHQWGQCSGMNNSRAHPQPASRPSEWTSPMLRSESYKHRQTHAKRMWVGTDAVSMLMPMELHLPNPSSTNVQGTASAHLLNCMCFCVAATFQALREQQMLRRHIWRRLLLQLSCPCRQAQLGKKASATCFTHSTQPWIQFQYSMTITTQLTCPDQSTQPNHLLAAAAAAAAAGEDQIRSSRAQPPLSDPPSAAQPPPKLAHALAHRAAHASGDARCCSASGHAQLKCPH
eukprot:scaffold92102_cov23-Tisochrysis_lutea.AAC.3